MPASWTGTLTQRERRGRADETGNPAQPLTQHVSAVRVVAGEHFVAPVTGKRHRHGPPRVLGEEPDRQRRAVGERFVQMPGHLFDHVDALGLEQEFVVVRSEALGHIALVGSFVVYLFFETETEGVEAALAHLAGQRDDGAGVDAAAQEEPDGHVAHQPQPHRVPQQIAGLGNGLAFVVDVRRRPGRPPVGPGLDFSVR